jgi:uncharacterized protein
MPPTFDDQYICLAELKEIDERLHHVERDAGRIPEDIRKYDDAITAKRADLDAAKALFTDVEKRLRAAERDLKEKEDALFKAEGKMMEVKTNEEYQAAIRENANQKAAKASLEDRVLTLINSLEEQKKALALVEGEFKANEAVILVDKNKLVAEHEVLLRDLAKLVEQRSALAAKLDPVISTIYLKIVATKKGVAIANADKGRCMGCNIQVRAQIYNEILGHKAIHRCTSCGKILVVPPRAAAAETAPAQAQ